MYQGDFALGSTIDLKFTTRRFSTGAPHQLAGSPVISAYPDNSTTQITAGITLTVDFDSVTGLNNVRVVASGGNGYAAGSSYSLVITTGTVDSVSVVGEVIGTFTLERSAAFGRLGAPAGASVSADVAAIKTQTAAIETDTQDIQSRIPSALVGGRIDANMGAISADATAADNAEAFFDGTGYAGTNNVIPTVTTTTNLTNAPTNGDLTATMKASVNAEVDAAIETYHLDHLLAVTYDPASKPGAADALLNELVENDGGVARYTANALEQGPSGGGGVADWTADERTAIRSILGIPGSGTTPEDPTTGILDTIRDKVDVVDGVADAILADTGTDGVVVAASSKTGYALSSAGVQAIWDALTSALTTAGSIGKLLVDNVNATISSRSSHAAADVWAVATRTLTAISDSAGVTTLLTRIVGTLASGTHNPQSGDAFARLGAPAGASTAADIAAVAAKTANLPSDPADQSAVEAAIDAAEAAILAAVPSAAANAAALLDLSNGVETSITPRQALRLILAASAGKLSGAATTTVTIRNVGDTKDRITATVDSDGNRSAVTVDAT